MQCIAITQIGIQCSRSNTNHSSGMCYQHQRMNERNRGISTINNAPIRPPVNLSRPIRINLVSQNIIHINGVFDYQNIISDISVSYNMENNSVNIHNVTMYGIYPEFDVELFLSELTDMIASNLIDRYFGSKEISVSDSSDIVSKMKNLGIEEREPESDCSICLDKPSNGSKVITPCCRQTFCEECLSKAIAVKNSCPLCRRNEFK